MIQEHRNTHATRITSAALPRCDRGPWERVEATCGIHNTPVKCEKGNVEKRNLANVAGSSQKCFFPTWMRKVEKVPSSMEALSAASDLLNFATEEGLAL